MMLSLLLAMALSGEAVADPPANTVTLCESAAGGIRTEVLRPAANGNGAAIVYVHGGNWYDDEGLKAQFGLTDPVSAGSRAELNQLAAHGYTVLVPHYRGSPRFQFPIHIIDLKCAVRALRARAAELRIDPDRLGVMGASAGGHLASLLGLAGPSAGWDTGPYPTVSSRPNAVAELSAPSDLTGPIPPLGIAIAKAVFGTAETGAPALQAASPTHYISSDAPPFLIVHGEDDPIVPPVLSRLLYDKLRAAGVPATLIMVRHAGHDLRPVNGAAETEPSAAELTRRLLEFFDSELLEPAGDGHHTARPAIDRDVLRSDLDTLAADDMQGRKPGTPGHDRARAFVLRRLQESGIQPVNGTFESPFTFTTRREPQLTQHGTNIVGLVRGTRRPDVSIVISAHYDHVGVVNGQVFNGADDNASGTAGLFALAKYFAEHPPAHTLVFAALDAEEQGLRGARAFLQSPPAPISSIVLNVNLDMMGRDTGNTLFAAGTAQNPFLKPLVERVAARAPITLRLGHDGPGAPKVEDWTRESDHYAFHERGIPFVYFGVEDEQQHHRPTDDAATITWPFYGNAVATVLDAVREFDAHAGDIAAQRIAPRPEQFSDAVKAFIRTDAPVIALTHARVIDGTGAPARANQTIVIREGNIAQLGEDGLVKPPADATVIDLSGKTVIPGLVMMHEHLYYPTGPGVYGQLGQSFIRLYLAGGVTTMRTGGNVNGFMDLKLKRLVDEGQQPGPAIDATAPYLNGPNSFLQMRALDGPDDARRQVEYWADMGATSFKAYMNITRAELAAAVEQAHKRGMKVTGHLCSVTYAEAADLGIDDLEHGFFAATDFVAGKQPDACPGQAKGQQAVAALDEKSPAFATLVKTLVDKHVALTSTLPVFETFTPGRPAPPGIDVLVPELKQQIEQLRERVAKNSQSVYGTLLPRAMALERAFARAGGLLLAGTDPTGGGGVIPGYSDQRELELLVEAGFTPLEAITIGTLNGARYLGRDARIGTIAAGKQADLVVIDGDPAANIADVRKVELVFKQGVAFDPAKLIASVTGKVGLW